MSGNPSKRRNWTRSLTIVSAVAIAGAVFGCLADNKLVETDRVYMRNSAGSVLFDHGTHNDSLESCAVCHHPLYSSAQAVECTECHDEDFTADDVSHARLKKIHNRDCATCHEQTQDESTIVSCRDCHTATQQSETPVNNCTECHDDSYTPDLLEHDEYLEVEDHSCMGCHSPRTVSEAYHTNCTGCHLESDPERFTQADGAVACGVCHLR